MPPSPNVQLVVYGGVPPEEVLVNVTFAGVLQKSVVSALKLGTGSGYAVI